MFHLQLLSHLNPIHYFGCHVEFLIQLLDDLVFDHSVSSSQTTFLSISRSESKHMVVLLRIRFPEDPQQWKLEFLPSIFPIVVYILSKLLNVLIAKQFFVLLLQKSHHPTFASWNIHIFSCFELHLDDGFLQKFLSEDALVFVYISVLMGLHKSVIDFGQLVVVSLR